MDLRAPAHILAKIQDAKEQSDGTQLDLPKLGLLSIPKQTLGLKRVRVLNLRANKLSMLPTEMCETLLELEFLNLAENRVSYLPENISSLSRLRTLLLHSNQISELPQGIGRLPLLSELRLEDNQLTGLPETFGRLTSVKTLILRNNALPKLPMSMVGMRALESLDVSGNPMDYEALPDSIHRLNEMYALLHSKDKRKKVIKRAVTVRRSVRNAVRDELFNEMAAPADMHEQMGAVAGGGGGF